MSQTDMSMLPIYIVTDIDSYRYWRNGRVIEEAKYNYCTRLLSSSLINSEVCAPTDGCWSRMYKWPGDLLHIQAQLEYTLCFNTHFSFASLTIYSCLNRILFSSEISGIIERIFCLETLPKPILWLFPRDADCAPIFNLNIAVMRRVYRKWMLCYLLLLDAARSKRKRKEKKQTRKTQPKWKRKWK